MAWIIVILGFRKGHGVGSPAKAPVLLFRLATHVIRPTALGKKNCLFIGDADAGQRSAIIYTVIENCRRRSLEPFACLRDVLTPHPTAQQDQSANPRGHPLRLGQGATASATATHIVNVKRTALTMPLHLHCQRGLT